MLLCSPYARAENKQRPKKDICGRRGHLLGVPPYGVDGRTREACVLWILYTRRANVYKQWAFLALLLPLAKKYNGWETFAISDETRAILPAAVVTRTPNYPAVASAVSLFTLGPKAVGCST